MIKMDTTILLGAIGLAYGGMLLLYYRLNRKEKQNKVSSSMLKGITSMRRGNLDKALIYFDKAYNYSTQTDNREEMADALYNMGNIYKEKNEIGNAVKYLSGAHGIYEELQDNEGREKVINAMHSIRN